MNPCGMTMQNVGPNFYLISGERSDPRVPTACWAEQRLRDAFRDDYMLVRIAPPVIGQKYRLGTVDIDRLILATHLTGRSLYPINEWPCHVYVMRIVNDQMLRTLSTDKDDVAMISWGRCIGLLRKRPPRRTTYETQRPDPTAFTATPISQGVIC
jgi:hypothetical protein